MISIDVITAYCGESQFNECTRMVKLQKNVIINHIILQDKDFLESQIETFKHAYLSKSKYVCKLDADMVLPDELYLYNVVKLFTENTNMITIKVDDFYSGTKIWGFHILRAGSFKYSLINNIKLPQPDAWLKSIKNKKLFSKFDSYILHGYNPTSEQCFRYGYSRGKKLLKQKDGVINIINFIKILSSNKQPIINGYLHAFDCNDIDHIDSIIKLLVYIKVPLYKVPYLYLKVLIYKWFM